MRIEHLALYVKDLEAAKEFFQTYFGAKSNDRYHNPKTGFSSYFLSFDDGARLEIMHKESVGNYALAMERMGYIHLAFSLGSKEAVDALTERFRADGYEVLSGPRTTGDGYYESAILGFEKNTIELTV